MIVEVVIVTSMSPTEEDLDNLRLAASRFTKKQDSITVNVEEEEGQFFVSTTFDMKKTAQYKVVDPISKEFRFSTLNLAGYQEMIISFSR